MLIHLKLNYTLGIFLLSVCLLTISCGGKTDKPKDTPTQGRILEFPNTLTFIHNNGSEIATLRYASAATAEERNQGLMNVRSMPQDAGMVFFFDEAEEQSFWMVNTILPLDIIYVGKDSTIVSIYHSTTPFSDTSLPSGKPAKYVIETNGGFCINYDIKEGNKVRFNNKKTS